MWDLLNGLCFLETNKNLSIFRGVRATQAVIMNNLLQSFLPIVKASQSSKFKFTGKCEVSGKAKVRKDVFVKETCETFPFKIE